MATAGRRNSVRFKVHCVAHAKPAPEKCSEAVLSRQQQAEPLKKKKKEKRSVRVLPCPQQSTLRRKSYQSFGLGNVKNDELVELNNSMQLSPHSRTAVQQHADLTAGWCMAGRKGRFCCCK